MADATYKQVLASISRLHGASAGEVAADLGVSTRDVLPALERAVEHEDVELLWDPAQSTGGGTAVATVSTQAYFQITRRGLLELQL